MRSEPYFLRFELLSDFDALALSEITKKSTVA